MRLDLRLRGALFDMDGTVVDVPYDWARIKADLGTEDVPILSYLSGLAEPERSWKWAILRRYEDEATERAVLKRGMRRFLGFLESRGIRTALITNNSRRNTDILLNRFQLAFDLVMTRESGLWKPSGAPLAAAMKDLGLAKNACCAIGDSHFDIRAAEEAGVPRIFILNRRPDAFRTSRSVEFFPSVAALKKRMSVLLG
ncbi:MAG: HAD-IA family hydrolase [Candidatus Aminicenantes bacterium]|nr:HAD-IA family hydrolase [Candidatus Aminicenantes bacterium]